MLTIQQMNQIGAMTDQLTGYLQGKEITADTLAKGLTALFGLNLTKAKEACGRMEEGLDAYRAAMPDLSAPMTPEEILTAVTADMTPEARKGFYLTLYDGYRTADSRTIPEAAASKEDFQLIPDHDEAALRSLAAQRLTIQGQAILDAAWGTLPGENAAAPHPLIHAAALYAAGVTGEADIPVEDPVLLGLGCGMAEAAGKLIFDNTYDEAKYKFLIALLALAVAVAIAIAGGPVVGKIASDLLASLSAGSMTGLFADMLEVILMSLKYWLPGLLSFLGLNVTIDVGNALVEYYRPLAVKPTLTIPEAEEIKETKQKQQLPADARM